MAIFDLVWKVGLLALFELSRSLVHLPQMLLKFTKPAPS